MDLLRDVALLQSEFILVCLFAEQTAESLERSDPASASKVRAVKSSLLTSEVRAEKKPGTMASCDFVKLVKGVTLQMQEVAFHLLGPQGSIYSRQINGAIAFVIAPTSDRKESANGKNRCIVCHQNVC